MSNYLATVPSDAGYGPNRRRKPAPPTYYGPPEAQFGPITSVPKAPTGGAAGPTGVGAGSIQVGGYTTPAFDYMSTFSSDPEYSAAVKELAAQSQAQRSQMLNAIKGLAVQWGGDLSAMLKSGLVDAETVKQAAANKFSSTAERQRDLGRTQGQNILDLAARGVLRGGGLTVGENLAQEQYQRGTQVDANQLNQNVLAAQQNFLSGEAQRQSELRAVRSSVYNRLAQMQMAAASQAATYQPSTANWDAGLGGYVTSDGRVYGSDGQLRGFAGQGESGAYAPVVGSGAGVSQGTLPGGIYWDPVQGRYVTPPGYRGM